LSLQIIIETTGLANPGPVAAALWTDEELETGYVFSSPGGLIGGVRHEEIE
jgi:G3E family GTPase